jgi:hypothetical protein
MTTSNPSSRLTIRLRSSVRPGGVFRRPIAMVILSVMVWSLALNVVAVTNLKFVAKTPHPGRSTLTTAWEQWDAGWYDTIIADGYKADHQASEPPGV